MDARQAYDLVRGHFRETVLLGRAAAVLRWDQQTMMPAGAAGVRSEELSVVETAIHARLLDPRMRDWLAAAGDGEGDPVRTADLREVRRETDRARRIPSRLVSELSRETSRAHGVWVEARRNGRFADFAPALERIVALKREEADCVGWRESPVDALLDEFEPGMTSASVTDLFGRLRPPLVRLLERIRAAGTTIEPLGTGFDPAAQLALARDVAAALGFDFAAGRLDVSAHPFTSGGVPVDVRMTTRTDADLPETCLYSTIHETGHALYEQGTDPDRMLTPAGSYASIGVHESQSRLWENAVGRSRPFCAWLFPRLRAAFPGLRPRDPEALYRAVNRVEAGAIRTEADEVAYNLHIILRFELERDLLEKRLPVADLEAAWNDRSERDLGLRPPDAARGVLQDVHWSGGAFGYFPTYTLGNLYAAELFEAARRDLGDLDDAIALGDFGVLLGWLREKVHRRGRLLQASALIADVAGHPPTSAPLVSTLEAKYAELYDLQPNG